jgi:hypothetical protein
MKNLIFTAIGGAFLTECEDVVKLMYILPSDSFLRNAVYVKNYLFDKINVFDIILNEAKIYEINLKHSVRNVSLGKTNGKEENRHAVGMPRINIMDYP